MNWMFRPGDTPFSPLAVANCGANPDSLRVMPGQNDCSLLTGIPRISAIPQVEGLLDGRNRKLLNGIAIVTTYPVGVSRPRECHTVSKLKSSPCPSVVIPSA